MFDRMQVSSFDYFIINFYAKDHKLCSSSSIVHSLKGCSLVSMITYDIFKQNTGQAAIK